MKKLILFTVMLSAALAAYAQKPALDHSVYDSWKTVSAPEIQDCGDWLIYTVSPQQGDGVLHLLNLKNNREYSVERASQAVISKDFTKAVFKIAPLYQQTRQAKIDKKKDDDMPKDTLAVLDLASGNIEKVADLKSFSHPTPLGEWIAFKKDKKNNDTLYVLNIKTMHVDSLLSVESFSFAGKSDRLAFITKPGDKDSVTLRGAYTYEPAGGKTTALLTGEKKSFFTGLKADKEGRRFTFFANTDTTKDAAKHCNLYYYEEGAAEARVLVKDSSDVLPEGWRVASKAAVSFHDTYLTFGTQPVPREKDTTLVDFEQARLDIWTWNEEFIQPIQKVNLEKEKNRFYLAKVNYDGTNFIQLADKDIETVSVGELNNCGYVIARADKPYRIQQHWSFVDCYDIYRICLEDGSRTKLDTAVGYNSFSTSPDGKWCAAFDVHSSNWVIYNVTTGEKKVVTSQLGVAFQDEEDDHPMPAEAYGRAIWSANSDFVWLTDRFDIWQIDPAGKTSARKITDGRPKNTTYSFASGIYSDSDRPAALNGCVLSDKPVYFYTFNHTTKERGVSRIDLTKKSAKVEDLVIGPHNYARLSVLPGKKQPVLVYCKGNFEEGNNLWISRDSFKSQTQLTDINPQQRDYNWGTVELVNWNAADDTFAEGLLFKPENFDPTKKYPVLIYFYERYSDELYLPRNPAPSASTINIPYFTSNEYICFIPDIRYKDGHPGKSCMNYLMPACDMLCEYPWVDGENMAIQGQSWGGYQVAYLITQTNRFKAAGAGAPVSNMTSAYGGIRWSSGIARTGQYEGGQSRIGTDLWKGFDLYVENSPLFFVPNVTTPVLIMHNDNDGAVPWWQGIEFFNALRRCGKEAWLLQYNGEEHNLMERRNRKDLSIRLQQFFDHYLKGKPMPVWMSKGVPATLKGIDYGFEYDE